MKVMSEVISGVCSVIIMPYTDIYRCVLDILSDISCQGDSLHIAIPEMRSRYDIIYHIPHSDT